MRGVLIFCVFKSFKPFQPSNLRLIHPLADNRYAEPVLSATEGFKPPPYILPRDAGEEQRWGFELFEQLERFERLRS
jgi:hypothetical protein